MPQFEEFNLSKPLLQALEELGFTHPTPIQELVFPTAMSGHDVIGIARTGTGKTIAYLLPCLRQWKYSKEKNPQILVLVPTRELVIQVAEAAKSLVPYMSVSVAGVYGGVNMIKQMDVARDGCDLLVATPGRLIDFVMKGTIRLKAVKMVVIDEVDEMLALGLRHQIENILDLLPPKRQHLLFSATLDPEVEILTRKYFKAPKIIYGIGGPPEKIALRGYTVPNFYTKANLIAHLLHTNPDMTKVLVFAGTRKLADLLANLLSEKLEDPPGVLHANKAQQQRFQTLGRFEKGELRVLIATDIAARGLDFNDISHVINVQLPDNPEAFIHRIGRTGRADQPGQAICLVSDSEWEYLEAIEDFLAQKIPLALLPEGVPVSELLTIDERPFVAMKTAPVRKIDIQAGSAFHEKKAKNTKVNNPNTYREKLKEKYKKPITRGQKRK